jgi:hypothetical protein
MQRPTDVDSKIAIQRARATDDTLAIGPLAIVGGCGHVGLPLGLAFRLI